MFGHFSSLCLNGLNCHQDIANHTESEYVGNKVKGLISKRVLQENKARHIFRKTTFLTP